MPIKASGPADEMDVIDRFAGGVGWIAHPAEAMQRASHALATDGGLLLCDPVDAAGLDELLAEHGDVAGVVVCLDRHLRDAVSIADRHDVPVYAPAWLGVESDLRSRGAGGDGPAIEPFTDAVPGTEYRVVRVVDWPIWHEAALYRETDGTLYVPEAVGTTAYFRAAGERLGVHPMLRPVPPRDALDGLAPERVLVGHGEGIHDAATDALRDALAGARRRAPGAYLQAARTMVGL
jgi:hypothetical protein